MLIKEIKYIDDKFFDMILVDLKEISLRLGLKDVKFTDDDLSAWVKTHDYYGFYAVENNVVIGFIFGHIENKEFIGPPFGFVSQGKDKEKVLDRIFKVLSQALVEKGVYDFSINVLNKDAYTYSLLNLGFAFEQDYGLIDLDALSFEHIKDDIHVRRLKTTDGPLLRRMAKIIYGYQNQAPMFGPASPATMHRIQDAYANIIDDKDAIFFIGVLDKPICFQGYWPLEETYFKVKPALELSIAGTFKSQANQGMQAQLFKQTSQLLRDLGYRWIMLDWRITNISSRRFWTQKCQAKIWKRRMRRTISHHYALEHILD